MKFLLHSFIPARRWPKPVWHAPWKCYRVMSGHMGWVRSVAIDPSNEWFATGQARGEISLFPLDPFSFDIWPRKMDTVES